MNISDYFESLRLCILNDSFILHVDILRERNRSKNGHFRARLIFFDIIFIMAKQGMLQPEIL